MQKLPVDKGWSCVEQTDPHATYSFERALIGSILFEPDNLHRLRSLLLDPSHFSCRAYAVIYESMIELSDNSKPIDYVFLKQHIEEREEWLMVSQTTQLLDLMGSIPEDSITEYCQTIINECALRLFAQHALISSRATSLPFQMASEVFEEHTAGIDEIRERCHIQSQVDDPLNKIEKEIDDPKNIKHPIPCGYADLSDILWGFRRGKYYILAARPSVGKTAVALNLLWRIIDISQANVMIMSLEQSAEDMERRLLSIVSGVDGEKTERGLTDKSECDKNKTALRLLRQMKKEHRYSIIEPTSAIGIQGIKTIIKRQQKIAPVDLCIIDQVSHLKNEETDKAESLRVETLVKSMKIQRAVKELDIPIILIVQIRRMDGKNERPTMSELKESGALEENADVVMILWRPHKGDKDASTEEKRYIELIVDKNKHGRTGSVMLTYPEHGLKIQPVDDTTQTTFRQQKPVRESYLSNEENEGKPF